MRLIERRVAFVAAAVVAASPLWAAPSAELLDLAGRVHYGYYHRDARTVEVAQAALDRLPDTPSVFYYRDFAALRRAQLGGGAERATAARLKTCAGRAAPAGLEKRMAAEASVLAAACALWLGDERRRLDALTRARGYDADNPRIVLVEAWALERTANGEVTRPEALTEKLTAAVEAFEFWSASIDDPEWGHAEALTALAGIALERGQVRTARDLVERALLAAPDYRAAVDLRVAIQGARDSDRLR